MFYKTMQGLVMLAVGTAATIHLQKQISIQLQPCSLRQGLPLILERLKEGKGANGVLLKIQ